MSENWTKERLKAGFDRFQEENGHLPTAPEVDLCAYLPSARQIQRAFGGLRALRQDLGYEQTDFGQGEFRSKFAGLNMKRGKTAERELEGVLIEIFGEPFVHIEKKYGTESNRADFFVYANGHNFGVDVFYSATSRDIQKNLNLKVEKYKEFYDSTPLYFVLANPDFDAFSLSKITLNMSKLALLPELRVMDMKSFVVELTKYKPLPLPIGYKSTRS